MSTEREAFEKWAMDDVNAGQHKLTRTLDGTAYISPFIEVRWETWQARAALAREKAEPVADADIQDNSPETIVACLGDDAAAMLDADADDMRAHNMQRAVSLIGRLLAQQPAPTEPVATVVDLLDDEEADGMVRWIAWIAEVVQREHVEIFEDKKG